jgi:N-methylhydantoinase A
MLRREGVEDAHVIVEQHAEMQYVGQSYVLPIALPQGSLQPDDLGAAERDFHAAHERAYGFAAPAEPTEIVNLRLATIGRIPAWIPNTIPAEGAAVPSKSVRDVYFAEAGGFTPTPILERSTFNQATLLTGPAIVEEMDSTTVIHPGYSARPDRWGNLVIGPAGEEERR